MHDKKYYGDTTPVKCMAGGGREPNSRELINLAVKTLMTCVDGGVHIHSISLGLCDFGCYTQALTLEACSFSLLITQFSTLFFRIIYSHTHLPL